MRGGGVVLQISGVDESLRCMASDHSGRCLQAVTLVGKVCRGKLCAKVLLRLR